MVAPPAVVPLPAVLVAERLVVAAAAQQELVAGEAVLGGRGRRCRHAELDAVHVVRVDQVGAHVAHPVVVRVAQSGGVLVAVSVSESVSMPVSMAVRVGV